MSWDSSSESLLQNLCKGYADKGFDVFASIMAEAEW